MKSHAIFFFALIVIACLPSFQFSSSRTENVELEFLSFTHEGANSLTLEKRPPCVRHYIIREEVVFHGMKFTMIEMWELPFSDLRKSANYEPRYYSMLIDKTDDLLNIIKIFDEISPDQSDSLNCDASVIGFYKRGGAGKYIRKSENISVIKNTQYKIGKLLRLKYEYFSSDCYETLSTEDVIDHLNDLYTNRLCFFHSPPLAMVYKINSYDQFPDGKSIDEHIDNALKQFEVEDDYELVDIEVVSN